MPWQKPRGRVRVFRTFLGAIEKRLLESLGALEIRIAVETKASDRMISVYLFKGLKGIVSSFKEPYRCVPALSIVGRCSSTPKNKSVKKNILKIRSDQI